MRRYAKVGILQARGQRPGQTDEEALAEDKRVLEAYLPSGYEVAGGARGYWYIAGEDYAGWTLDGYVLPRLGSGLIWGEEVSELPGVSFPMDRSAAFTALLELSPEFRVMDSRDGEKAVTRFLEAFRLASPEDRKDMFAFARAWLGQGGLS